MIFMLGSIPSSNGLEEKCSGWNLCLTGSVVLCKKIVCKTQQGWPCISDNRYCGTIRQHAWNLSAMAQRKGHCHCFGKDQTSPLVRKLKMAAYVLASGEDLNSIWLLIQILCMVLCCLVSILYPNLSISWSRQSPSLAQGIVLKSLFTPCFLSSSLLSAGQVFS